MDYVQQILGKSMHQLTYHDIAYYFQTDRTENEFLEFKSCPPSAKFEALWKAIFMEASAFLNSNGGVIIWGAPMERQIINPQTNKKEKHCQGELTSIDPILVKDTIVSRISTSMTPLASGIVVVVLDDGADNRVAIIEVKPSNYAPHQTDNTYYMRLDGQTVHAPHPYIEALIKRVTYPNLEGFLNVLTPQFQNMNAQWAAHYVVSIEIWIFNFSPMENEENLFFSITSNFAKPLDRMNQSMQNIKYNRHLDELVGTDVMSILMNGHPYTKTVYFQLNEDADFENGLDVNFILKFGGKKSPLKYSRYVLRLNGSSVWDAKFTIQDQQASRFISDLDGQAHLSRAAQLKHYGFASSQA